MHWPWVSRLAYDAVCDERDRLRSQNDRLEESLVRLARTTNGLPEATPQGMRHMPDLTPMLKRAIRAYGSLDVRADLERRARRRLARGDGEQDILADFPEEVDDALV